MSGFESDDTIVSSDSDATKEDLARLEHQTKQPRTTLSSKESDRELSETAGFLSEASSSNSRSLTEPLNTDTPFRSSVEAWGLGKRRNSASPSLLSPSSSPSASPPSSPLANPFPAELTGDDGVGAHSLMTDNTSPVNATDELAMATASGGAYTSENVSGPTVDAATRSFWQATFGNAKSAFGVITASTAASAATSAERVAALHAIGRRGSDQQDGMQVKPNLGAASEAEDDSEDESSPSAFGNSSSAPEEEILLETENLMDSAINQAKLKYLGRNSTAGDYANSLNGSFQPSSRGRGSIKAHPSPQERWSWGQYMAAFSHLSSPSPDVFAEPGSNVDSEDDDSRNMGVANDMVDGLGNSLGTG